MTPTDVQSAAGRRDPPGRFAWARIWPEALGLALLMGLTVWRVASSWRTWNHPLIDFGRELYIPWRLAEGDVLYRDVDDVYGPLSQYFNAAIFRVFGPGVIVLVLANLVIFGAILAVGYGLFRRAWGAVGALAACAVFVSFFAFSQFLVLSNFNFATPYAHEATHGFLVCLALVAVLGRWLEEPTRWRSFAAGLLGGLTLVLKPEFILAAAAVTVAAGVLRWRRAGAIPWSQVGLMAAGGLLPTAAFAAYFSRHFPLLEAVQAAGRAWTSLIVHSDILGKKYQLIFMGLDRPWGNFLVHLRVTLVAIAILGVLGGLVHWALKRTGWSRYLLLAIAAAAALGVGKGIVWDYVARCLLALNLLYLAFAGLRLWRQRSAPGDEGVLAWRILLGVLAAAMMARMVLNGRFVQFGFFQAALATMVIAAILCAESAEWMPAGRGRRRAVAVVAAALLVPGMVWAMAISHRFQRGQTFAVGAGRDRFYSYETIDDGTGYLVNAVVEILKKFPRHATLFALPEGEMINYLARLRSPLPQFQFYSFTTEGGREREVVKALDAHPPDVVVIASRDLTDFGIAMYGERDGAGRQIIQWLAQHYHITHQIGDNPLDSGRRGASVLERKPAAPVKN